MEQKYGYVPAFVKTNENLSSVSSALDLNTPSVLTTVCGISSRFVQVIVVPTGTVKSPGPKLKLSIFTSAVFAGASWASAVITGVPANDSSAVINTGAARHIVHPLFLVMFRTFLG